MQPLVRDSSGTRRFKQNAIVTFLLDSGPFEMNDIAEMDFTAEDRVQFAQLIGYSLNGFGELPYVDDTSFMAAKISTKKEVSREQVAQLRLETLCREIRRPMAKLFGVHPDDLKGRG